ncbi:MAG TPA: hypothetical protein VMJ94_04605 [Nitrososphaera sp.]|nr:hypothetical protein [Nitrososphaera sp.]
MTEGIAERIHHLVEAMNRLELQIASEAEAFKDHYARASAAMQEDKNYFLNGVQTGSVIKSYLLTRKGVEVPGEGTIQVPEFIDSVLRFANYPKRKIEVLTDLAAHLQNFYAMIGSQEAQ